MRTWMRTVATTKCGCCPAVVEAGAPIQVVTLPGVSRPHYRCEQCADEPAPFLPAQIGHLVKPEPSGFTQIARPRLDFKAAQAGREPGEDG